MGLIKTIVLDNGVNLKYHRVASVHNITNHSSIIEVAGYTSPEKRNEEKKKLANNEPMDIYIETKYISKQYEKNLNVDSAYAFLKTTDEYSGALDD